MNRWLLILAFIAATVRAEAPSDFAYGITLVPDGQGPFARIVLPSAVYEGAMGPGLADVRVFNAEGAIVPFALVAPVTSTRYQKSRWPLSMFPLRVTQDVKDVGGLTLSINQTASGTAINLSTKDGQPASGDRLIGYILDTGSLDEPLTGLTFAFPETVQATTMRLSVEASDDLASWRTVTSHATLINLEYAGRRLLRDRVDFAPTKAKYFRLSWRAGEPLIGFIGVGGERGEREIDAERQWREAAGHAVSGKDGDYEYDLGGAFPIDRIGVDLVEVNSIVPVQVFARSTPKDEGDRLITTVFYRLSDAGNEVTSPPVEVSRRDYRYWLLRVDPRAGAGREPPRLRAGWLAPTLVFAVRGAAPFTLAYGKHAATNGALPIATLVPGYDAAKGLPASVGTANVGVQAQLGGASRLRAPPDTKRWLLWATLVLGAAILGWMAYRLSKQIGVASAATSKSSGESATNAPNTEAAAEPESK